MANARLWCSVAVIVVGSVRARAQCEPRWLPFDPAAAPNGVVTAVASFENDLIAGGVFTATPGQPGDYIAAWDGETWHALGSGVNGGVGALEVWDQALIVGGSFTTAGGRPASRVARWDGTVWTPLGPGLAGSPGDFELFNAELFAANGRVHRWNGASWTEIGPPTNGNVWRTLTVHDGHLVAGGTASGGCCSAPVISRWNGTDWQSLGSPYANGIAGGGLHVLGTYEGSLLAGGWALISDPVQRRGTDQWGPVGIGLLWRATALAEFRGELVAGGDAFWVPGAPVTRWSGTMWEPLGAGFNGMVWALAAHDGDLIAGGDFTTAGGQPSPHIARWGCLCEADCNNSGSLTVADFGCFQSQYVLAHPYADCNADGQLTVADFGCFQGKYVLGCP